jgi:hypothetical protein
MFSQFVYNQSEQEDDLKGPDDFESYRREERRRKRRSEEVGKQE